MKKVLIAIIALLLIALGLLVLKKENRRIVPEEPEVPEAPHSQITGDFTSNIIKLTNRDNKDNFLISPYSIKVALNMLKEGADGNTLAQINKVLANTKVANIDNPNIKIANAVFISNRVKDIVEESFVNTIKNNYQGEVLYDNFKTPKVINDWVNEHTNKMIPKLLDSMEPNFVAGLANAIAIDVKWAYQFDCPLTTKEEFTKKDNTTMNVQMMHHSYETSDVSYFDNDKTLGVILPYTADTNLEFVGFIPKGNIDNYLNSVTSTELANIGQDAISAGNKLHIELSLPRFKYDFDLKTFQGILQEMGMTDAFIEGVADFSKIIPKDKDEVSVSEAIHKTAIDLNEKGTKAAAVTYFGLKDSAAIIPEDFKTVKIELNKTFVYMIREKTTKEILFFGVVNTPNKWSGSTCE